ncbi:Ferrous iron transport protein B [Klebsiella oxytoca]|nr:Ferrous iron transport protein B [Klebsiella oxytoca]
MKKLTLGLIGNPNSGKTTLFNQLTGARQRVGNWAGVTVERKEGGFNTTDHQVTLGSSGHLFANHYLLTNLAG